LADGLSEDMNLRHTSLKISYHPNLNRLMMLENCGLYEPSRRLGLPNPETYVVFPFFLVSIQLTILEEQD